MSSGRVIQENKTNYLIAGEGREFAAVVRGKFHIADEYPKVGDYVEYVMASDEEGVIEKILPRRTQVMRKAPGTNIDQQVIVTNVDKMLIVMGLDGDFNLNRLERYVLLAEQSSILPIIILNKSDVVSNPDEYLEQVRERYPHVEAHLVSAHTGKNMDVLLSHIHSDTTAVLLGSSGAGKSTISNWLLNDSVQETQEVRSEDSRGRHTTTARQLFSLPHGGYLIDTPGMRELALVGEVEGDVFSAINELSSQCKFSDCDHEKSSGCAIQEAIASGAIDSEQLTSLMKLKREKQYLEARGDQEAEAKLRQQNRKLHKKYNKVQQEKYGRR